LILSTKISLTRSSLLMFAKSTQLFQKIQFLTKFASNLLGLLLIAVFQWHLLVILKIKGISSLCKKRWKKDFLFPMF